MISMNKSGFPKDFTEKEDWSESFNLNLTLKINSFQFNTILYNLNVSIDKISIVNVYHRFSSRQNLLWIQQIKQDSKRNL